MIHTISKYTHTARFVTISAAVTILMLIAARQIAAGDAATVFTIAQVPDTQEEVVQDNSPLMANRYQWLSANKDSLNLKFIAHTGDVTNWGVVDPEQYARASQATNILDQLGVPYSYAIGNHDGAAVKAGGSAAPGNVHDNLRNTALFNQTFPVSRLRNVTGTFEPNKADNIYQTFSAGGVNWLVITHELWPRQAVVDWMKDVTASHPAFNVIVSTHAFVNGAGQLPTSGNYGDLNAQQEWDQYVSQYPNIKMILNGHYGATSTYPGYGYFERTGVNGNKVALVDTAYHAHYQNHVRLLKIDAASGSINSSVYVDTSTNAQFPSGEIHDGASDFVTQGMNWILPDDTPIVSTDPTTTVPAPPYQVNATSTPSGASVAFKAPPYDGGTPITSYTVMSTSGVIMGTGSGSPIDVSGLTSGASYSFVVTAANVNGTGAASTTSNSVSYTALTAPDAPANVTASPGNQTATLSWTQPTNTGGSPITDYVIEYKPSQSQPDVWQPYDDGVSTTTSVIVPGLSNGTSYDFHVAAVNAIGQGVPSTTVSTSPLAVPDAPTGVTAVGNNSAATISFSPPVNNGGTTITGYTVTSSPGGLTASGSGSPIAIGGLANGTAYTFTVIAVNSAGSSVGSAPSNSVTPATTPGVPTSPIGTPGAGRVNLSWTAPASNGGSTITDYVVQYRTVGSSTWLTYADGVSTATTAVVSTLTNGVNYEFQISAQNAVGLGAPSTTIRVTPTAELLLDPGFETGTGGWIAFSIGTFTRTTTPVHGGTQSLKITSPQTAKTLVGMTQNTVISNSVAGQTYTAQCYVRPTTTGLNIQIRFLEYTQNFSSNTNLGSVANASLPTNTWTLMKVSGKALKSGNRIIPQIYSSNQTSATGSISYDDCSVTAG